MVDAFLRFAIARRWVVLFLVLVVAGAGVWSYQQLPIDAVPDITNVQVQINTSAPGYSPLEVEQRITYLVETAIAGLPSVEYTRSLSRYGLSQVTVVFADGTDIYFARNLINERLQQAKGQMPAGLEPGMGPIATGLGEIFMYSVRCRARGPAAGRAALRRHRAPHAAGLGDPSPASPGSRRDRGEHHRRLREAVPRDAGPGAAARVRARRSTTSWPRCEKNNASVGAGYIERNGEQYLIRSPGQIEDIEAIEQVIVDPPGRRADHRPGRCGRRPRQAAALRRRHSRRQRNRAGHGRHAGRREQPHGVRRGRRQTGRGGEDAAGRGHRQAGLRPHGPRGQDHRHRPQQPARGSRHWWWRCCC